MQPTDDAQNAEPLVLCGPDGNADSRAYRDALARAYGKSDERAYFGRDSLLQALELRKSIPDAEYYAALRDIRHDRTSVLRNILDEG